MCIFGGAKVVSFLKRIEKKDKKGGNQPFREQISNQKIRTGRVSNPLPSDTKAGVFEYFVRLRKYLAW